MSKIYSPVIYPAMFVVPCRQMPVLVSSVNDILDVLIIYMSARPMHPPLITRIAFSKSVSAIRCCDFHCSFQSQK
jgi:hypothetical protein